MSTPRITLLLLAGSAVQTLLPPLAGAGSLELPLLTGLLIYITLRTDYGRMIYAVLLAGLLYDSFSPAPFGISLPFFLVVGAGTFALRNEVFEDRLITYAVLGLAAAAVKIIYFSVVFPLTGLRPLTAGAFMNRLTGSLLAGALFIPVVYLALCAMRYFIPEPRKRLR